MPPLFRSEFRAFARALRRGDPLAWAGLGGAFVLLTYPVYWVLTSVRPLWAGNAGNAGDYRFYYDAGLRLLDDPRTLYAIEGFIYPPPMGAVFAAMAQFPIGVGYVLMAALNVAVMAACLRLGERIHPAPPRGWARAALWTTALGCAPALQNIKFGQLTPLVLASGMLFLIWLPTRPARAGAVLALGAWLKVYPAVLGVFALRRRTLPAIAGAAAVAAVVPLLVAAFVPASVYMEYVTGVLPRLSRLTVPTALNGGLPAFVQRLEHPPERLVDYVAEPMTTAALWTSRLTLLGGVAAAAAAWVRGWPTAWAGLAALGVLAVSSPVAWEYTFLLAMPTALAALLVARRGGVGVRGASALATLALFVQKPPEPLLRRAVAGVPGWVLELFVSRFLLALVVLGACALWVRRSETRNRPSAAPPSETGRRDG